MKRAFPLVLVCLVFANPALADTPPTGGCVTLALSTQADGVAAHPVGAGSIGVAGQAGAGGTGAGFVVYMTPEGCHLTGLLVPSNAAIPREGGIPALP